MVAAAHAERVMAVAHVSSRIGAWDAVRSGIDGLAHGFSDTLLDESLAREMVARRVFGAGSEERVSGREAVFRM